MSDELKYWYLRDHKLFWTLSIAQVRQLAILSGFKRFKKGDVINFSSSAVSRIFLLKKGNIKIIELDEEGNEIIKDIIQKGDLFGDLFGDLTLENDNKSNEYAIALTEDVIICSFLQSDFENLMLQHPYLALTYTKFVGLKMKRIKKSYSNLRTKDAKTRLQTFIKEWAEKEGRIRGNKITVENYLTQSDMAQIIGASRQTTTVLLKEMEKNQLIVYSRKEILIEDITKL